VSVLLGVTAVVSLGTMAASVLLVASNLHWQSVAAFFVMLVGYTCFNGAILWWFYRRQPNARDVWKVQPKHSESFDQAHRWRSWWIPAFTSPRVLDGRKPAPYARLLPTVCSVCLLEPRPNTVVNGPHVMYCLWPGQPASRKPCCVRSH